MATIALSGDVNALLKSTDDLMNCPMMDITIGTHLPADPVLDYEVEVKVKRDGKVVWVNLGPKCVLRICGISGKVLIADERTPT